MHLLLVALAAAGLIALIVATLIADVIGRFGFPFPPNDRRIGCVDGLRGYLALSVMTHHFFVWIQMTRLGSGWSPPANNVLNQLGASGVGLFFMTTGLVFYPRILCGLRLTPWLAVFVSRFFRIVPLVTFTFGLVTAIIIMRTGVTPGMSYIGPALGWISAWSQPSLLGYPDTGRINAHVLWSLKFEWIFYLFVLPIAAALMDMVRSRHLPTWLLPVAFLGSAVAARILALWLDLNIQILYYLPLFAMGMLAFECQKRPMFRAFMTKPIVTFSAAAALLIGMITTKHPYTFSLPLFGFFFICVACGNSFGGLLSTRGALILGECSFGIYLMHGILLDIVFVDGGAMHANLATAALPIMLPGLAAVIISICSVTYLVIERPAMRQGQSLSRWLIGRRVRLDSRELEVAP